MRGLLISAAIMCAVLLAPASSLADDGDAVAAAPTLSCNLVGVRILMDDLNGARLVCRITGAASADSSFAVSLSGASTAQPLCHDGLADGEGTCRGGMVDPTRTLNLTAILEPSGTQVGPVALAAPAPVVPSVEPPMQFYPLGDQGT